MGMRTINKLNITFLLSLICLQLSAEIRCKTYSTASSCAWAKKSYLADDPKKDGGLVNCDSKGVFATVGSFFGAPGALIRRWTTIDVNYPIRKGIEHALDPLAVHNIYSPLAVVSNPESLLGVAAIKPSNIDEIVEVGSQIVEKSGSAIEGISGAPRAPALGTGSGSSQTGGVAVEVLNLSPIPKADVVTTIAEEEAINLVNGHAMFHREGRWASGYIDEASMAEQAATIAAARRGEFGLFVGHGDKGIGYAGNLEKRVRSLNCGGGPKALFSCWSGVGTRLRSPFSGTPTWRPSIAQELSSIDTGIDYIGMSGRVSSFAMGGGRVGNWVTRWGQAVRKQWIGSRWRDGIYRGPVCVDEFGELFDPNVVTFLND